MLSTVISQYHLCRQTSYTHHYLYSKPSSPPCLLALKPNLLCPVLCLGDDGPLGLSASAEDPNFHRSGNRHPPRLRSLPLVVAVAGALASQLFRASCASSKTF